MLVTLGEVKKIIREEMSGNIDCVDCEQCKNCNHCKECKNCSECINCYYCVGCMLCTNCIECSGQAGASYMIGNEQLTQREWYRRAKEEFGL